MPVVNPLAREIVFKIVYYGPGLGGKTTTLQHIYATTKPEHRGKMVSLATPVDRTLYFDFLPIRLPNVRGMAVRMQLFTVPGQVYYNATRKLVLTGADGVVMVVDSQRLRLDANLESLDNLRENLREHGRMISDVPHVFQYNKRDLKDILSEAELDQKLNRHSAPAFPSVATRGGGVYESLEAIARTVMNEFEQRIPEHKRDSVSELYLPEGGITEALRRAEGEVHRDEDGSSEQRKPSGTFELAALHDVSGEKAARALTQSSEALRDTHMPSSHRSEFNVNEALTVPRTSSKSAQLSFESLWPSNERSTVRVVEQAIAGQEYEQAVALSAELVSRVLASAASVLGATSDAPRDPSVVCLLLGLDGRRYMAFRSLLRDTRGGHAASCEEALSAYAFAIDARLACNKLA